MMVSGSICLDLQDPQVRLGPPGHQHLPTVKVEVLLALQGLLVPLVLQELQASQERLLMTSPIESSATFKVKVLGPLDPLENQELSLPTMSSLSCREMM